MVMAEDEKKAVLFDISHYMIEDGPGIRTDVFFKGCPLRCKWCSNPFGLTKRVQLIYNKNKCVQCLTCVSVCPRKANVVVDGKVEIDRDICVSCGSCCETCLYDARTIVGREYSIEEIFDKIQRDRVFYRRTGGGVTLTGGEILLQADAAAKLLRLCRQDMISTAIETSGYGHWADLERLIELSDLVFIDIKHMDSETHQRLTGVSNQRILENIRKAASHCSSAETADLIIRVPIIPGLNDDDLNLESAADFLAQLTGIREVNLLPYHRLGANKYDMLGLEYTEAYIESPISEQMSKCREMFLKRGVQCTVGGGEITM
jgi:glycyl-radical enzyme activating protein